MRKLLAFVLLIATPAFGQVCNQQFTLRTSACPGWADCTTKGSQVNALENDANLANIIDLCEPFDATGSSVSIQGDWIYLVGPKFATSGVCIWYDSGTASLFQDTDCDETKDAGEEYLNNALGAPSVDSVGTAALDDDANSPVTGAYVIVETGNLSFDYLSPNAGTDVTTDLEEESHASEHADGAADEIVVTSLASACTDGQVLGGDGSGGVECQTDLGSELVLDLADDDADESTGLLELATTGDTNSIFTEPSDDKLLIDLGENWPIADQAEGLVNADYGNVSVSSSVMTVEGIQFGDTMPVAPDEGDLFYLTDADSADDCDPTGGGGLKTLCYYNGASWEGAQAWIADDTYDDLTVSSGGFTINSGAVNSAKILDSSINEADFNATNAPSDTYVLSWNTGDTLSWVSNSAGSESDPTLTDDDAVTLGDDEDDGGADFVLTFDADTGTDGTITWDVGTDEFLFSAPISVPSSATPTSSWTDSDTDDEDVSTRIVTNCTATGTGAENCDMTFEQQVGGNYSALLTADADGSGDARIVLPDDSIGPDEILSTGQTDEYCLTYETGGLLEWQTCGTGGGLVRQAASDCTAETGGVTNEQCHEIDDDNLYVCETGPCNGSGWVLYGGGGSSNSFATIDAPTGTDPVADSASDTLQLVAANNMTITGADDPESITFGWSGAFADAQVDGSAEEDEITHDNLSGTRTATVGDSATAFFSSGTIEAARLPEVGALTTTGGTDGYHLQQTGATTYEFDWTRIRYHASDCTSITDGEQYEPCWEVDDNTLYVCETATCNAAGWQAATAAGDGVGYDTVEVDDTPYTSRANLNFIQGSNVTISCVDDSGDSTTDCTFSSTAGGMSNWDIADDDGTPDVGTVDNGEQVQILTGSGLNTEYTADGSDHDLTIDFVYSLTAAGNPTLGAEECIFTTDGTGGGFLCEGSAADEYEGVLEWPVATSDKVLTLPNATDTLVARSTSDTLQNKTIDTANNTITVVQADISDLAHTATDLTAGIVEEQDLEEASGSPTAGDVLTYDGGGSDFNWEAQSTLSVGSATTASNLAADGVDALTEISTDIKTAVNDTDKLAVYNGSLPGGSAECVQINSSGQMSATGAACGTGGGNAWSTIGSMDADTSGDTMTLTDNEYIDFVQSNDPEDLQLRFNYAATLVTNPALSQDECIFTTAGNAGFICEGDTGGNTAELFFQFPTNIDDAGDTTYDFVLDGIADKIGTDELDDDSDTPGSGDYIRVDTVDQAGIEYRTTAEVLSDIGAASSTHAASHSDGAADEVTADNLATACSGTQYLKGNGSGGLTCATPGGTGDVEAVGPGCSDGACLTDGKQTTGTTLMIWEGTTADANQVNFAMSSADPGGAYTLTFPDETGTVFTTATALTGHDDITTINDGDYCQGGATSTFDCDVTTIPATDGGTGQDSSSETGIPEVNSGTWSFGATLTDLADVTTVNDGDYCQGDASSAMNCDVTTIPNTDGGTGQDSSSSTGIPMVSSGTWSFDADANDLANVTTITDGQFCQGAAANGFDCDVATIPEANIHSDIARATGDTYSGIHNWTSATSHMIEYNASLTVGSNGEIGIDTNADQLVYRSSDATHVLSPEYMGCATLESPTDTDDNVPIIPAPAAMTITAVACHVTGTSASITFEDNAATPNTIKSSVSCQAGSSAMTYDSTSLTNTAFTSGEFVQFDTVTQSSPGWLTVCVKYTQNQQ